MLFRVRFFGALFAAIVVASAAGTTLCTGCALWASRVWYGRPGADPLQQVEPVVSTEVHLPLMVLFVLGAFLVFNRISTEAVCRLSNLVVADIVDEDRVQFQRYESRAASIFGLQALISKPQVSLAPMVGWWVLDMAGFQPAPAETVPSSSGTSSATASASASWLSELWAQFTSSLAFDAAAPAGVADLPALSEPPARSPTLLWAATALLFLVPLVLLSIQQLAWRRYTLHSARLRAVKYALRRLQQEHGDVSADAEAAEEEVLHQQDDVLELKEV
jgi:Na+/melibiose symporter-like transporter